MRAIKRTPQFRRDFKRVKRGARWAHRRDAVRGAGVAGGGCATSGALRRPPDEGRVQRLPRLPPSTGLGATAATATFDRTWCSCTASAARTLWNSCGSGRTRRSGCEQDRMRVGNGITGRAPFPNLSPAHPKRCSFLRMRMQSSHDLPGGIRRRLPRAAPAAVNVNRVRHAG